MPRDYDTDFLGSRISRREFLEGSLSSFSALSIPPFLKGSVTPGFNYAFVRLGPSACEDVQRSRITSHRCHFQKMFLNLQRDNVTYIPSIEGRMTLHEFVEYLKDNALRPVDNIIVGTHFGPKGLWLHLFRDHVVEPTNFYEALERTMSEPDKSISIPDDVIGYNGASVIKTFNIKGCALGKHMGLLRKFKEALGGRLSVVAPLHFHNLWSTMPGSPGVVESMSYEFDVLSPRVLTRDELIAKFSFFSYYDDQIIPLDIFQDWVSNDDTFWNRTKNSAFEKAREARWYNFGTLVEGYTMGKFDIELEFRKETEQVIIEVPTTPTLETLAQEIDTLSEFNTPSDYPRHVRLGFTTKEDFLNGHSWQDPPLEIIVGGGRTQFEFSGTRYRYTLKVPITDRRRPPHFGHLIFNYYPGYNSVLSKIQNPQLIETDSRFYARV